MTTAPIRRQFGRGATLFREGDPGDCAYIIEHGAVEISAGEGAARQVLATRVAGDIFGEMAIVDSKPRSATVTAVEDTQVLVVSKQQLQARIQALDPVLRMVLGVILDRFRDSVRRMSGEAPSAPAQDAPETVERFSPLAEYSKAFERIELEQTVKHAVSAGEMTLFYQPIVRARDGAIAGFEGLARWNHPLHGILSPGVFMPAVEDSGLMGEFTRWAVHRAAEDAARFARAPGAPENLFVSVNVTADDICDPSFVDFLAHTLDAVAFRSASLELEVTEASLASNPKTAIDVLGKIRALGPSISIDDFGTGYSNLTYLTQYPVQKLKIDKSFVDKLNQRSQDSSVVASIIRMSHAIGLKTVAEGIEDAGQAETLREFGCDLFQGYLYHRPQPFEACLAL
ncbi:MAG: EAL domain-containing protein, partial [Pseudomonadota bacterium]